MKHDCNIVIKIVYDLFTNDVVKATLKTSSEEFDITKYIYKVDQEYKHDDGRTETKT